MFAECRKPSSLHTPFQGRLPINTENNSHIHANHAMLASLPGRTHRNHLLLRVAGCGRECRERCAIGGVRLLLRRLHHVRRVLLVILHFLPLDPPLAITLSLNANAHHALLLLVLHLVPLPLLLALLHALEQVLRQANASQQLQHVDFHIEQGRVQRHVTQRIVRAHHFRSQFKCVDLSHRAGEDGIGRGVRGHGSAEALEAQREEVVVEVVRQRVVVEEVRWEAQRLQRGGEEGS